MNRLRILLADDHAVVREGLKALLNAQPEMEVIGEAGDGQTAFQRAKELEPDVVVMDISMRGWNGAQATEEIKRARPHIKVLALTVHEDKGYLRQLLEAGASGYVLKRQAASELIYGIRVVAEGGVYLDPTLAGAVLGGLVRKPAPNAVLQKADLSDREAETLRLIAQGYSNKEIAAQLDLSVKSVETYKARAMEKLGLHSRTELVRYALHRGWLEES